MGLSVRLRSREWTKVELAAQALRRAGIDPADALLHGIDARGYESAVRDRWGNPQVDPRDRTRLLTRYVTWAEAKVGQAQRDRILACAAAVYRRIGR